MAILSDALCTVPTSGPQPLLLRSTSFDLQRAGEASSTLEANAVPLNWFFTWARLFSPRIPDSVAINGVVDASLARNGTAASAAGQTWTGGIKVTFPPRISNANGAAAARQNASSTPLVLDWMVAPQAPLGTANSAFDLQLPPTPVRLSATSQIVLAGDIAPGGYDFRVAGTASPAQLEALTKALPQLGDSVAAVVPDFAAAADMPERIDFLCSRAWQTGQTCTAAPSPIASRKPLPHRRR